MRIMPSACSTLFSDIVFSAADGRAHLVHNVTVRDFPVHNVTLREFNVTVVISRSYLCEIGVMTLVCGHFLGREGVTLLRRVRPGVKKRRSGGKTQTSARRAHLPPGKTEVGVPRLVAGRRAITTDVPVGSRGQKCFHGHESGAFIVPDVAVGAGDQSPTAVGWVTSLAPASLSRRWKSGEERMIVPAAARKRSTAASSRANEAGRSLRYSNSALSLSSEKDTSMA